MNVGDVGDETADARDTLAWLRFGGGICEHGVDLREEVTETIARGAGDGRRPEKKHHDDRQDWRGQNMCASQVSHLRSIY